MTALPHSSRKVEQDDGWIEWAGGRRPVAADVLVSYRLRGFPSFIHDESCAVPAGRLYWHNNDGEAGIVAYRIIQP